MSLSTLSDLDSVARSTARAIIKSFKPRGLINTVATSESVELARSAVKTTISAMQVGQKLVKAVVVTPVVISTHVTEANFEVLNSFSTFGPPISNKY